MVVPSKVVLLTKLHRKAVSGLMLPLRTLPPAPPCVLSDTNPIRLLQWQEMSQEINRIEKMSDNSIKTAMLIEYSRRYEADYVLVIWDLSAEESTKMGAELIYSKSSYFTPFDRLIGS